MALVVASPFMKDGRAHADPADISTLVSGVRALGHVIPELAQMSASCDGDALCAARFLKDSIGPGAAIIPAIDTQPTRTKWLDRKAPLRVVPDPSAGGIFIEFYQFDAPFLSNIFNHLAVIPKKMILDVRGLQLSDELSEIRRTASLFTGKTDRAFRLVYATGRAVDWHIPKPKKQWSDVEIIIRLDDATPSNGLAFAAIMARYANARIEGGELPEPLFLHRLVPIMHGWDMLVPSGEVRVPK